MKRLALAAAIAALSLPALAADLPTLPIKTPILSNTYPITTGIYFGMFAAGASTSVQASGIPNVNTAGLNEFGGSIGGTVGYLWGSSQGNRFFRANLDVGWQNLNGQSSGLSASGPVTIQAAVQAGVPFAQIAALLPTFNLPNFPGLPALPLGVTSSPPHMYGGIMADIEDVSFNYGQANNTVWTVAPGLQIGMLTPLSNGMMMDARFEYIWNDKGTCIGGGVVCATQGNTSRFKMGVQW